MIPKGAKCWACFYWDRKREICTRDGSGHAGEHRENLDPACEGFRGRTAEKTIQTDAKTTALVPALQENVDQLGRYLMQMGQMMNAMQRRLDEMEARQAAVTISHAEAKRLQALIRGRADELCRKYNLQDKDSPKIFRAAIKKDLLKRFLVKDLHDLPAAALVRAEALLNSWGNIRLVMERRGANGQCET